MIRTWNRNNLIKCLLNPFIPGPGIGGAAGVAPTLAPAMLELLDGYRQSINLCTVSTSNILKDPRLQGSKGYRTGPWRSRRNYVSLSPHSNVA